MAVVVERLTRVASVIDPLWRFFLARPVTI